MPLDLIKTLTYLTIHLTVGFTVAYVMTGSVALAGGIAAVDGEPRDDAGHVALQQWASGNALAT